MHAPLTAAIELQKLPAVANHSVSTTSGSYRAQLAGPSTTPSDTSPRGPTIGSSPPAAHPIRGELSLTHDMLAKMFATLPACQVAEHQNNCQRVLRLAQQIVSEPKRSEDSWAYGVEYELRWLLAERVAADPKLRDRAIQSQVICNTHGCLLVRLGPINLSINYAYEISKRLREDATVPALNDGGRWPREYVLHQGDFEGQSFELIEFRR